MPKLKEHPQPDALKRVDAGESCGTIDKIPLLPCHKSPIDAGSECLGAGT